MDELERYRKLHNLKKEPKKKKNWILNKILFLLVLFVGLLLAIKINPSIGTWIKTNVYNKNFSFANIERIYNKYFGSIMGTADTSKVFSNTITYTDLKEYYNGVELTVDSNNPITALMSGVVIFIGEKENYGNTIVISQVNGIEAWYGNVTINDVKLYDYVEKEQILGTSLNNKLYLVFMRNGEVMDYKQYVS